MYLFTGQYTTAYHKFFINYQIIAMIVLTLYSFTIFAFIFFNENTLISFIINIASNLTIIVFLVLVLSWSFTLKDVIYEKYENRHPNTAVDDTRNQALESQQDYYANPIDTQKHYSPETQSYKSDRESQVESKNEIQDDTTIKIEKQLNYNNMLNWRAEQKKNLNDFEWVVPGIKAWVYNKNIIPGKKIFLDVEVLEINQQKQKVRVKTKVTDKIDSEFQLQIFDIYKYFKQEDNTNHEDISKLKLVNAPEIFNFLKDIYENEKQYFFCGLDLYFLNRYQNDFQDKKFKTNLQDQQQAIQWLIDEKTLKPKTANVSTYVASVIKNFLMTFKTQCIFLQGEVQSGKASHMIQILQFLCFYNKSDCQFLSTISLQRTKSSSSQVRRINIDSTLKLDSERDKEITLQTQKQYFKSYIDFDSCQFVDKFEHSEIDKQSYYNKFNQKIIQAYKIIQPFTEVINSKKQQCSACTKIFYIQSDEEFKFVSFKLDVKFLQMEFLKGDKDYNFQILYYIFQGIPEEDLRKRGLLQNVQRYDFINDQVKIKNAQKYILDLQNFLGNNWFDFVMSLLICIAEILTMQSQKISNQKIQFLETQFGLTENVLGNYLRQKENFEQKKLILLNMLYQSVIDIVIERINQLTQKGHDMLMVYNSIEIIDCQGYNDKNRYGDYDDYNDNGFTEFVQNFINEKIYELQNDQRYLNEKKVFKKEGLSQYLQEVDFRSNKNLIENLKQFLKLLNKSQDIKEFKKNLEQQYEVFLKSSFSLLNQKIEDEEESFIYFVSLKHFFSQIVNYNLQDIFSNDQCSEQIEQEIRDIIAKSFNYSDIRFQQVLQIKNSKIFKIIQDIEEYFETLNDKQIHFFGALKIIQIQQEQEYGRYLYKQFDSIDFESQIQRYKENYPYKIDYAYLVDKFNVMNSAIHINPHLVVDYKKIVSNILINMFSENHVEKFLLGKELLFVKEDFFEEFDQLIKELNEKQSRLDLFIHKAMNQLLKEHLNNSSKIIKIGRIFLENNCCYTKIERWKIAMQKMINNWRRKQRLKHVGFIIDICLNNIEYYNLKLIAKIQAHVRGFIWRLKHQRELTTLKKMKFKKVIQQQTDQVQQCVVRLDLSTQKLILQQKQKMILDLLDQSIQIAQVKAQQIIREQKIKAVLQDLIFIQKVKRLVQRTRAIKKAQIAIKRFLLIQKFKRNLKKRIKKKRHLKRAKQYQEKHDEYINLLNQFLKKNQFTTQQIKIFKPPSGKLKNEKVELYFQNLYLRYIKPNQQTDQFLSDYFDIINKVIQTNDNILMIQCDDQVVQFLTKKQNLYILKYKDRNIYHIKLNKKVFQIGFLENQIIYITQQSQIDYQNVQFEKNKNNIIGDILNESNHTPFLIDTIKNYNWYVYDFAQKFDFFVLTTHCHRLYIKNLKTDLISQYQFKRKICCFSIGQDFVIALDQGGVLYGQGNNSKGQLGIGNKGYQNSIIVLEYLTKKKEIIKTLSCGQQHTFVASQSGKIYCWGDNSYNQLGSYFDNNIDYQLFPQQYPQKYFPQNLKTVQIKCGQYSTYFLFLKKQLYALGTLDLKTSFLKPKKIDLTKTFNNYEIPVQLNVQYNESFELVYLRCLSSQNSKFYNFVYFQKFANQLFKIFVQNNQALIPFQENISKDLNLQNMSTKLVEINNKEVVREQEKEVNELFFQLKLKILKFFEFKFKIQIINMRKRFEDLQNIKESIKIKNVDQQLQDTLNEMQNEDLLVNYSQNVFAKPSLIAVKKKKIIKKAQQKQSKKNYVSQNDKKGLQQDQIYKSITKDQFIIEAETTTCFGKQDQLTRRNSQIENSSTIDTQNLKTTQKTMQIPLDQILLNEFQSCTGNYNKQKMQYVQQLEINNKMRSILVRWLYQVAISFKFRGESFFLAIQILDNYTQRTNIKRDQYQLVGVTALFMAAKVEEIYPPKIRKYVSLGQQSYNKEEIIQMEYQILMALNFKLKFNTVYTLLSLLKVVQNIDQQIIDTALFLANAGLIKSHVCTQNYDIHAIGVLQLAYELNDQQILFENLTKQNWFPGQNFVKKAKEFQLNLNLQQCFQNFFQFMQSKTNYQSYLFKI